MQKSLSLLFFVFLLINIALNISSANALEEPSTHGGTNPTAGARTPPTDTDKMVVGTSTLPSLIWAEVFKYLGPADYLALSGTSKQWRSLLRSYDFITAWLNDCAPPAFRPRVSNIPAQSRFNTIAGYNMLAAAGCSVIEYSAPSVEHQIVVSYHQNILLPPPEQVAYRNAVIQNLSRLSPDQVLAILTRYHWFYKPHQDEPNEHSLQQQREMTDAIASLPPSKLSAFSAFPNEFFGEVRYDFHKSNIINALRDMDETSIESIGLRFISLGDCFSREDKIDRLHIIVAFLNATLSQPFEKLDYIMRNVRRPYMDISSIKPLARALEDLDLETIKQRLPCIHELEDSFCRITDPEGRTEIFCALFVYSEAHIRAIAPYVSGYVIPLMPDVETQGRYIRIIRNFIGRSPNTIPLVAEAIAEIVHKQLPSGIQQKDKIFAELSSLSGNQAVLLKDELLRNGVFKQLLDQVPIIFAPATFQFLCNRPIEELREIATLSLDILSPFSADNNGTVIPTIKVIAFLVYIFHVDSHNTRNMHALIEHVKEIVRDPLMTGKARRVYKADTTPGPEDSTREVLRSCWTPEGYLRANPGLANLFDRPGNETRSRDDILREHYDRWGKAGGLSYLPENWSAEGYLKANPGLSNLFGRPGNQHKTHEEVLKEHYLKWGQKGGKKYFPMDWSEEIYARLQPRLTLLYNESGSRNRSLTKMVQEQYLESKPTFHLYDQFSEVPFFAFPPDWTPEGYLAANRHLRKLFDRPENRFKNRDEILREHYQEWGQQRGLNYITIPLDWTPESYLAANPGLANMFGRPENNYKSREEVLKEHYLFWGKQSGRAYFSLPPDWTTHGYLAANPHLKDVATLEGRKYPYLDKGTFLREHYFSIGQHQGSEYVPIDWETAFILQNCTANLNNLFVEMVALSLEPMPEDEQ